MTTYLLQRLSYMIPTLLGIMALNFFIIQAAPGGPVDQFIAKLSGEGDMVMERITGQSSEVNANPALDEGVLSSSHNISPELLREIKKLYGFDKPIWERFTIMLKEYATFDFGNSFFKGRSVVGLLQDSLPVSMSLGIWSTLVIYLISIPLGIRKAIRHGSRFDAATGIAVVVGNAIPVFLFAILLIMLFAGGNYLKWFPLRGLVSPNFETLSFLGKITDYFRHMALPITAMVIGGFATLTMLTKNSFLDEIGKLYVVAARAKGLTEKKVLYGHVFRNAMLIVISGFPSAFIHMFFTGSLLVEVIFSLNGLGLLGFEAAMQRDYPVMFGTLYIFTLMGLFTKILSDLTYTFVDPRIDFDHQEALHG
ncbi:microcin C ABC transporter permease YejB [Pseudodesulfovibrio sediminis]|uniref:ABC transporter permease n=1 Tax=Pseudodesulfovibrio sediminis TaxID=2810563 RepID=A0ABN6ETA5_9BACT|nr:microcin C ABC transporter permease YejB [Pseudodesulfovibrio sediminis]BCS88138.1 ABC transporter permease [Pseudodesulfovibrio sediminis]